MSYRLFDMTDAEIDRAVQSYYDKMYDDYCRNNIDIYCENCRHYDGTCCELLLDRLTDKEYDQMRETGDYSAIQKDKDDYCDDWEAGED